MVLIKFLSLWQIWHMYVSYCLHVFIGGESPNECPDYPVHPSNGPYQSAHRCSLIRALAVRLHNLCLLKDQLVKSKCLD